MERENRYKLLSDILVKKPSKSFIPECTENPIFLGYIWNGISLPLRSRNVNFTKILTHHTMMICLKLRFDDEHKKIPNIFISNVILNNIKFTISKFHNCKIFGFPKYPVYIKILLTRSRYQIFAVKISL